MAASHFVISVMLYVIVPSRGAGGEVLLRHAQPRTVVNAKHSKSSQNRAAHGAAWRHSGIKIGRIWRFRRSVVIASSISSQAVHRRYYNLLNEDVIGGSNRVAQKMGNEYAMQTGAKQQNVHDLWINPFVDAT